MSGRLEYQLSLIQRPRVTEKTAALGSMGQYAFRVASCASKDDIARGVAAAFNVKVMNVRTMVVKGKTRRTRFGPSRAKNWKKALVTLAEGQTIDFDQVESK